MWNKKPEDAFDRKKAQGSAFDKMFFTDDELKQGVDINRRAESGEITWGDAHDWWENTRNKYGYTGGENGHGYTKLDSKSSNQDYSRQYQNAMNMATTAVLNRKPFEYDPNTDPMYQQYAETYTRLGQRAMDDTIGKVSARTGGLASSYATTAATQANDQYMAELAARVPELRKLAYDMYLGEDNRVRQNLQVAQGLDAAEYGRYRDSVSDAQWQQNFDRQKERDAIADAQYNEQLDFNRGLTAASLLAQNGNYSGYKDLLGLSDADVEALNSSYIDPKALQSAELMAQAGDFSGFQQIFGLSKDQVAKLEAAYKKQMAGNGSGSSGMTLTTAKEMASFGMFTDEVLRTLRNAGYTDEYLKQVYGYGYGNDEGYENVPIKIADPQFLEDLSNWSKDVGINNGEGVVYGKGLGVGVGFGPESYNTIQYNGKSYSSVEEMVDAFAATNPSDEQIKEFEEKYLKPLGLSFE